MKIYIVDYFRSAIITFGNEADNFKQRIPEINKNKYAYVIDIDICVEVKCIQLELSFLEFY